MTDKSDLLAKYIADLQPKEPDWESLYQRLGRLVADMPKLTGPEPLTADHHRWLGRAAVLVEEVGDTGDAISIKGCANNMGGAIRDLNAANIEAIVHRALARAEAKVAPAMQGAFLPVGAEFNVLQVLSKVLGEVKGDVLIVDPYMDAKVLTDFAPLAPEGARIRLLSDSRSTKPEAVMPAAERWVKQYGASRPLEVRLSAPRALHDRLIFVDEAAVYVLSQSLKDFAARSPASVVRVEGEAVAMKLDAYAHLWAESKALI